MCLENERERETQQLCTVEGTKESVTFRFLKPTTTKKKKKSSSSTRRLVYMGMTLFFCPPSSFSRSALTRTQGPQKEPSPLEKGVIQVAFLLPSPPARCPGNGSTSRTSFVESTRHSKIHSCLPFFFFFLFFSLPFRLPRNEERERISFVKILHQSSFVSFAEIFSP